MEVAYIEMTGTKRRIFEVSVKLFAEKNFETVTMNDIAKAIGVKKPSLYAHFASKQEILDTIYDYFCIHYVKDRPLLEAHEDTIRNGSIEEIVECVFYTFSKEYTGLLISISKIIENRKYVDARAKEIASTLMMESGIHYAESVFARAVEVGRIAPLNTRMLGVFFTYIRFSLFQILLMYPERQEQLLRDEDALKTMAYAMIVDMKK